jgi:hypothetical protein
MSDLKFKKFSFQYMNTYGGGLWSGTDSQHIFWDILSEDVSDFAEDPKKLKNPVKITKKDIADIKKKYSRVGNGRIKMLPKDKMKGKGFPDSLAEPNAARRSKAGFGQNGQAGEYKNDGSKGVIPVKQVNSNTSKGDNRGAMSGWAAIGQSPNANSFASVGF